MPLDDREQQILAEIERQFYEEDPDLAHAVRNIDRSARYGVRLPVLGSAAGVTIVILFFTVNTFVALGGFLLMVLSITALVQGVRNRTTTPKQAPVPVAEPRVKIFRRFRRG
jgi:hypothetical protein